MDQQPPESYLSLYEDDDRSEVENKSQRSNTINYSWQSFRQSLEVKAKRWKQRKVQEEDNRNSLCLGNLHHLNQNNGVVENRLLQKKDRYILELEYSDPKYLVNLNKNNSCNNLSLARNDEYCRFQEPSSNQPKIFQVRQVTNDKYQTMSTAQHPGWASPNGSMPPPQPAISNGMPVATVQNPASQTGDSYFTESRKGEVNELRNLLRNFTIERDPKRKRDVIKKVIAYMTLGIDVSRLFTEMMLAIETRDLVVKKMVYLFLCNYATANPDLAQMCTNTLHKDCGNEDPMVRGLALRAICSLRLPQMVEYIAEPVRRGLNDGHSYVRKTAVMGLLKLYHLDGELFEREKFCDTLYDMLRDPDAAVVTNCIIVLNEVMAKGPNGGMAINRAIMLHLLNRCHEFDEFGIISVLELVPKYIPADDEEGYQIMNLLDPVLRTTNAGAFVAVIRAFLSIAANNAEMIRQVVSRAKAPLVTMMSGGSHELSYTLLKHIDALIELCPNIFDDEFGQFYARYSEPTPVKYLKIEILAKLVNPNNAPDIVSELSESAYDNDQTIGALAIRSLGRIACRDVGGDGCAESIARRLVDMLDLDIAHISSEAAIALNQMLRRHPSLKGIIYPPLPRALKYISKPQGKTSIIYLLGECGDELTEAPYSLEKLIDSYDTISDSNVKIALLTSTVKLFFKRPPEVQKMLGRLLKHATEDVSCQDVHDRALWYYRILRTAPDPSIIETVVQTNTHITQTQGFSEENIDDDIRDELMKEFNTLSIIYGSTSDNFIAEEYQIKFIKQPKEHPLSNAAPVQELSVNVINEQLEQTSIQDTAPTPAPIETAPAPVPSAGEMDLLGFDGGMLDAPAQSAPPTSLSLSPSFTMSGDLYQSKWGSVPDDEAMVTSVPFSTQPPSTDAVEKALSASNVMTMASGELPDQLKFFLYAEDTVSSSIFMVQMSITKGSSPIQMNLTVKVSGDATTTEHAPKLLDVMKSALSAYV